MWAEESITTQVLKKGPSKGPLYSTKITCSRGLFFKPCTGFGSRAAYRGDKLTHRGWKEILAGDYVAQALILLGQRTLSAETTAQVLKFDVRIYAYAGEVLSVAARLYQGQTTNFRTLGGGFAPVYPGPHP